MTEERKEEIQNVKNEKVSSSRVRRPYHKNNKKNEKIEGKAPRAKKETKTVEENKNVERKTTTRRNYNKKQPKFEFKKSNLKINY